MVSSKINDLTEDDLNYLEMVLNREFKKHIEYVTGFKSKNHYDPGDKTKKLSKLLDAVRSQQKLLKMPKW
jgi:hypothetical protein